MTQPHMNRFILLSLTILLALISLSAIAAEPFREDTVWDVRAGRAIGRDALIKKLRAGRYILLGERHDNPDHHRRQAWIIKKLSEGGRRPALVFEMVERHKQNAFQLFERKFAPPPGARKSAMSERHDATGLEVYLDWANSGWPAWTHYKPLFDIAYLKGLPLGAAGLPRHDVGRMHRQGLKGLPEELQRTLGPYLAAPLPGPLQDRLRQAIMDGHCHALPEKAIGRFMEIQRVRDAAFAEALLQYEAAFASDGAVLITGNGHARKDLGAPRYLREMGAEGQTLSLAFLEISPGGNTAADHAARFAAPDLSLDDLPLADLPFDYVWFTARRDRPDPCALLGKTKPK